MGFKLKQHSLNYNLVLPFILGFEVWQNATLFSKSILAHHLDCQKNSVLQSIFMRV